MDIRFISEKTENGEVIIFDKVTKDTHILNATATLVYELSNSHSCTEIATIIKNKYPDSPSHEEFL